MNINLPNDKLGFYTVNGKKFYSKIEAILFANETLADIEWNFNKEIFNRINWQHEPEETLLDLYRSRAKQLREEYDYIIVLASGGADSTNVVYSFLKNGIHIDEIVFQAPVSGLNNWKWDNKNIDASNTISETKFAQFPLAQEIHDHWPDVKLTVNDYFQEMLELKTDDWVFHGSFYVHPSSVRYSLNKISHIKNLAESGKKIAKIFGLDKPTLVKGPNGMIFNTIVDGVCQVGISKDTEEQYPNLETVYFYFTPDLPQMMVKQAHVLAKWIYLSENESVRNSMADATAPAAWNLNEDRFSHHHRANIPIIYPILEGREVFQAKKSFQNFTHIGFDAWFHQLHGDSKISQMILSDFNNIKIKINKKYFNEIGSSWCRHTQNYLLGYENNFKSSNISI